MMNCSKTYRYSPNMAQFHKPLCQQLQAKMTEDMLDQIPPLVDLKTFLCRLSVGDYSGLNRTNGVKNPGCTLIELVPQVSWTYSL